MLSISNHWEEDLRAFINGRKTITVCKVIESSKSSMYNDFLWQKGINYSNRESSCLTPKEIESKRVSLGFHFYNNTEHLAPCSYRRSNLEVCPYRYRYPCPYPYRYRRSYRLIKLTINSKDLVAVGKCDNLAFCVATKATWNGKFIELKMDK